MKRSSETEPESMEAIIGSQRCERRPLYEAADATSSLRSGRSATCAAPVSRSGITAQRPVGFVGRMTPMDDPARADDRTARVQASRSPPRHRQSVMTSSPFGPSQSFRFIAATLGSPRTPLHHRPTGGHRASSPAGAVSAKIGTPDDFVASSANGARHAEPGSIRAGA
jgi:hypothetical protein